MDMTVFDINLITNIVKKILQWFEEWNSKKSSEKEKYSHIDITISRKNTTHYSIQITNYGQFTNDILFFLKNIFYEFVTMNTASQNSLIATIYSSTNHNDIHDVLDLKFVRQRLSLIKNMKDKNLINFCYQKKYLSLLLKTNLTILDLEKFITFIINEIVLLQQLNFCTKFTVHIDQRMIYNNYVPLDDDYKLSQALVSTLTNVIKQSLDVRFKENCFFLLNVEDSHAVKDTLMCKILPLIHENYTSFNRTQVGDISKML